MQAVVLAVQKGFNLGKNSPEAMTLIAGRPKLEHVLNRLPKKIKQVIFVLGYRGDIIKRHFGNSWQGREVRYVWQYRLNDGVEEVLWRARKMLKTSEFLIVDSETIEISE